MLMSNSLIDIKQKVYLSTSGRIEYFGDSPMGLLLTMYTLYHPAPHQFLSVVQSKSNTLKSGNSSNAHTNQVTGLFKTETNAMEASIKAYFDYFHHYCPIVNKMSFLTNFSRQSPILVYMVCALGCSYIPSVANKFKEIFTDRALFYLKSGYLRASVDNATALLMMGLYQHHHKEFPKGWLYMGMSLRMCYSLGLDRHSPKLTEAENESRSKLWYWGHILDKFYAFSLNRPWTQDCSISSPKYPSNYMLEVVREDPAELTLGLGTLIYLYFLSELCHLMNMIVRKFKFTEALQTDCISSSENTARAISKHLDFWKLKSEQAFDSITNFNFKIQQSIITDFQKSLMLIYYGVLVQLYQVFSEIRVPKLKQYYYDQCNEASKQVITVANEMGDSIIYSCTTYKFYALSSAIMIQIKNGSSKTEDRANEGKKYTLLSLSIMKKASPYFTLATECYRLISLVANVEGMDYNLYNLYDKQNWANNVSR
ncbi:hypothetical protein K502DRAFT_356267 [Neoconidiobolus thromboides FSU 785]|nr:hypothetical protein K502DRAFT_356267 [Neoconidiobolus thromboides FSU 785]